MIGGERRIMVDGPEAVNRAVDGDVVVVELGVDSAACAPDESADDAALAPSAPATEAGIADTCCADDDEDCDAKNLARRACSESAQERGRVVGVRLAAHLGG